MRSILLVILIFSLSNLLSQEKPKMFNVRGEVIDSKTLPLPYVSVGLFSVNDSTLVRGTATELNGRFSAKVPSGKYFIKLSFLSYREKVIDKIVVNGADVDLEEITLEQTTNNLEEFEVVEDKQLMELELDKRVFNVDKDVTNLGANGVEILEKIPSVSVNVDGNISLRGSDNVRILINGKPSPLTGRSSIDALRQIQGTQIEKVEVITNPSSRYDAEGEVGIINIVLKKSRRNGINGSVHGNLGYPGIYGGGFNLNLKSEKITLFTGFESNTRGVPNGGSSSQNFFYPDTSFSFLSESKTERSTLNNFFVLGADFRWNEYNSLSISGNVGIGDGDNEVNLTYKDFDEDGSQVQTITRNEVEDKDLGSFDFNLNYQKTFVQKNRKFTVHIQHTGRTDDEHSTIIEQNSLDFVEAIEQRVFNNERGKNWLFQTDYIHPMDDGKIEAGLKYANKRIDDEYAVEEFNNTIDQWEFVPGFKNFVLYKEDVSASYLQFSNKLGEFSYQLGLRLENTRIKTELLETNEVNTRDYLNLFPSTHLSYGLDDNNSLQISYSRRIQRPRNWWLLPFFNFTNFRSNFRGNPNLNPEFTDSYELSELMKLGKGSILTSFYYRDTKDAIRRIRISDAEGITESVPVNIGSKQKIGVELSYNYSFFEWLELKGNSNFFRRIVKGSYDGINYDNDGLIWTSNISSKFRIRKKFNVQLSLSYWAPERSEQGRVRSQYSFDPGFSWDVFREKGTLSFNVRDLFNTRKWRSIASGENFSSESVWQWRSRSMRLNFIYRINQRKRSSRPIRNGQPNGF